MTELASITYIKDDVGEVKVEFAADRPGLASVANETAMVEWYSKHPGVQPDRVEAHGLKAKWEPPPLVPTEDEARAHLDEWQEQR